MHGTGNEGRVSREHAYVAAVGGDPGWLCIVADVHDSPRHPVPSERAIPAGVRVKHAERHVVAVSAHDAAAKVACQLSIDVNGVVRPEITDVEVRHERAAAVVL